MSQFGPKKSMWDSTGEKTTIIQTNMTDYTLHNQTGLLNASSKVEFLKNVPEFGSTFQTDTYTATIPKE